MSGASGILGPLTMDWNLNFPPTLRQPRLTLDACHVPSGPLVDLLGGPAMFTYKGGSFGGPPQHLAY